MNSEVAIMDEDGQILDPDQRGEVVVRGPLLFDRYENDPEANAAAFVDGWYHTGDVGYFDADGYLFLTGRLKEMINRGGQKIAPSEIDDALNAHPAVMAASAFPVPHLTLGEEVAVAVTLEAGSSVKEESLSDFLRERLAGYKMPRRYIFVDEIPKGPTGKVQRHKLAAAFGLAGGVAATTAAAEARPATALEAKLQVLWATALGRDHVGLYDNFFLLGGDSLQAVDLFLAIEAEIGRRLPRAVLFEAGTVAEMAACIESDTPSGCVVPIQTEGERPPFFCVHDQDGHVLNFRDLARHLGTKQPFYGLQYVGLNGEEAPFTRMEDMATHYVREIRKIQPTGPYYIGGYSFGGRVAYAMAQQLRASGESVALLALLDTYYLIGQKNVGIRQWLARHCERIAKLSPREVPAYLALRVQNVMIVSKVALQSRLIPALWHIYERLDRPVPRFLHQPTVVNDVIRRNDRPRPYEGDVVLFQAELPASKHEEVHEGWRNLIKGGLEIRPVPGRHSDFLTEPHVCTLAAELSACLGERRERHSQSARNRDAIQ
jgi:thioesterase domain-containing protein/acyl carrier protein